MTRDEFEELLDYGGMMPYLWSDRRELLLAEYDRLTALNAQLLEACKSALDHLDNADYRMSHIELTANLQAAIRAAEEEK